MKTNEELKNDVKEKYSQIALNVTPQKTTCCGTIPCCDTEYSNFNEDYSNLPGYNKDADLSLGCGIPTAHLNIKEGDTVVDLGSGAGNDAFVARQIVGESGRVIGIDMTEPMIEKANINNKKLGYTNVEFRLGEIENLPIEDNSVDVILSNCVLNLVPDKRKAFSEINRILKTGGSFSISDIVLKGKLSSKLREVAELYAGCVSGALQKEEYLEIVNNLNFKNVKVVKERKIELPAETLEKFLNKEEIEYYNNSEVEILSITVTANK